MQTVPHYSPSQVDFRLHAKRLVKAGMFYASVLASSHLLFKLTLGANYDRLSVPLKLDLTSRVTSTVNAVYLGIAAMRALLTAPKTELLNPWHHTISLFSQFGVNCLAYFAVDFGVVFALLYGDWKRVGAAQAFSLANLNMQTLFHHVLGVLGTGICWFTGNFHYFALFRATAEWSTPFLNLRAALITAQKYGLSFSSALPRLINWSSIAFAVLFFVTRLLPVPWFWKQVFSSWHRLRTTSTIKAIFIFICASVDILNLFWFSLIFKRLS